MVNISRDLKNRTHMFSSSAHKGRVASVNYSLKSLDLLRGGERDDAERGRLLLLLHLTQREQSCHAMHAFPEGRMCVGHTSVSMLSATLTVASKVPKDGGTSGSKAGAVKLNANSVRYGDRSMHCVHSD